MAPNQWFVEFQKSKGKESTSLGDMDWKEVEDFLAKIPPGIEQLDFLATLERLPDDGVARGYLINPERSNRNQNDFLKPLRQKKNELLSRHFDLDAVLAQEDRIVDHGEAIRFLHDVKEEYLRHHPTLVGNSGQPEEWRFYHSIDRRIQRRKDLRSTEMQGPINITGDANVVGNQNMVSVSKTTVTSGATMADFTGLLAEVRAALESAELGEKTTRLVKADLDVVEAEVTETKPDKSIVEAKLASMAAMAKNAAAIATAGGTLLPLIHKAIEMAHGLF